MRSASLACAGLMVVALAGCAQRFDDGRGPWHNGQIIVGTGNTTGVFYQFGGGLADAISNHLPGYEATVAPTAGSADNLVRLGAGDVDIALTFTDVAADAMYGGGAFAGRPQRIRAIAAVYRNYAHLVVRADAGINAIADLRGKRVSTGPLNSGAEFVALRLLRAAKIDKDRDIAQQAMSLPTTTRALRTGILDAAFWTGGLPTAESPTCSPLSRASSGSCRSVPFASRSTPNTPRPICRPPSQRPHTDCPPTSPRSPSPT